MDERSPTMTPDEEVAMIFSSDKDDGPTTSKRARLISTNQASGSHNNDDHFQYQPGRSRSIGHRRQIWEDSSDSDPVDMEQEGNVYPNVEAYLSSIPKFDAREHRRIPHYMSLLGDNARQIRTELPTCDNYSAEEMEVTKGNFILSQLNYLIRVNVRRTTKAARNETRRLSLIKPLAQVARKTGYKSE